MQPVRWFDLQELHLSKKTIGDGTLSSLLDAVGHAATC